VSGKPGAPNEHIRDSCQLGEYLEGEQIVEIRRAG
jgi:hypothetical protein